MEPIKLSIVIPTYNEEENIKELLSKTHSVLDTFSVSHELIVVDDGSNDKTREIVKNFKNSIPEIILIERDHERGLASAMVRGYNTARGKYLGAMDADLAHNPDYLPSMLAIIELGEADFVIGSRYVRGAEFKGKPLLNKIASKVGQYVIQIILGLKIKDTSNNYRIFRRELWENITNSLHPDGNIMLTEIVYLAHKKQFRICEIPIVYMERRAGKSKLSVFVETKKFFQNIWKIRSGN